MAFELLTLEDQTHHNELAKEMHPDDEKAALLAAHQLARENLKNAGYVARLLAQRDSYKQAQATGAPKKRRRKLDLDALKQQAQDKKDMQAVASSILAEAQTKDAEDDAEGVASAA